MVHNLPTDINTLMHIIHDFQIVDSMLESEQKHKLKSVVVKKEEPKRPILPSWPRDHYPRNNTQGEDQRAVINIYKMSLCEFLLITKSRYFYQHPRLVNTHNVHTKDQSK